jgi:hypothetical protein
MDVVRSLGPIHSPDGSVSEVIHINAMHAPVSGCLVLGTIAGDYDALEHIKSVQHLPHGNIYDTHFSTEEITILVNAYRLFGHDVLVRNALTGTETTPWAASRECVIEPASVGFRHDLPGMIRIVSNKPRDGRNISLPNISSLVGTGGVVMSIARPTISVNRWQFRKETSRAYVSLTKAAKPAKFLIKSPLSYAPVQFTARTTGEILKQDFQFVKTGTPPAKPEGRRILETHIAEDVPTETPGPDVPAVE